MSRQYSIEDVLAYMDVPLPEDDEMSDDDFDGYLDEDDELDDDEVDHTGSDSGDNSSGNNGDEDDKREIPEFCGQLGCTQDMTNKSPIDFLQLLITDEMLEAIVVQTNLFAEQFIDKHELSSRSRVQQCNWSPHDVAELRKFLALVVIMGLVPYPCIEDSWVTSWPFATTTFSSVMSRDRFSLILRFIHLNDSTKFIQKGQPGYDPLFKLRPFLDPLIDNFQAAYTLGREISVDESMIGFKGRLWFVQYLPKKPTKWGMKAFVLAESVTGYTYNWRLYAGMGTNIYIDNNVKY